jgi:hypothetical protein
MLNDLSGMIETARAKAAPHDALSSSRKLIPPENVVWRSPTKSLAAINPLPRLRQYGDEVGNFPDIVDLSEGVMNLRAAPSKVHWQNANRSNQVEISHRHNRMMTGNPVFTGSFMRELTIGLTRIWLIWLKMRCKPPHKVVQTLSINQMYPSSGVDDKGLFIGRLSGMPDIL